MILKRLFQSNWRKDDSAIDSDPELISLEILQERLTDADPKVRKLAYGQVTDLNLLQNLADTDADEEARDFAAVRLRNLLTGKAADSPPLEQRIAYCENLDFQITAPLISYVLQQAVDPELRLSILSKINDPTLLTECALRDPVASLRLAAVERLQDKTFLEQVARTIGKKDKGVYKLARQRLKIIAEQEQAPIRLREEAEILIAKMDRFVKRGLWVQDKTLVDLCMQQWAALSESVPEDLVARFNNATNMFQTGYDAYHAEIQARAQAEAARAHLYAARHALLEELSALENEIDPQVIETRCADIENRWQFLGDEVATSTQLQERWGSLVKQLKRRVQEIKTIEESRQQLANNLAEAKRKLAQSFAVDAQFIREWRENCKYFLAKIADDSAIQEYEQLLQQLQQRLDKQQEHAKQRLQRIPERLDSLEQEIDTGVLRQAHSLYQSIQSDLAIIKRSGLHRRHFEHIEHRLNKLLPRLRELQSWRKWGTNQHRVEMCEVLEHLATEPLNPTLFTEQVQTLQQEWKELDRDGTRVSEHLRKRFHHAVDKIYELCRPYIEEQNRQREQNIRAREELCQQVEGFLEKVNWAQMDWKKAVRAVREVRTTWESLGPVDAKHHHTLNQRYRSAMRRLSRPLAQERAKNRILRQNLIQQAQALIIFPDVNQAIAEIRRIQDQWQITVATTRSQEDTMWQTFRSACDKIFERRRESLQVQHEAIESQVESLSAICEALENLAKAPGGQNMQEQFEVLEASWKAGLEQGLPRPEEARLQRRWQQGLVAMRRRIRLLEEAAQRSQMERLRTQAALCAEIEMLVEQGTIPETDKESLLVNWQTRWANLSKNKDPAWQAALERRFNAVITATQSIAAHEKFQTARIANGRERSLLCLQMEILAGIQSPPEALQERLEFQVSRLAGRLSQGVADPLDEFPQLERAWYACGPSLATKIEAFEQRFERARRVLSTRSTHHEKHDKHDKGSHH